MPENRIQEFDEFMKFVEELDKIFNSYGRSLKTFKENIKTKRGLLTENEINKMKADLQGRLKSIQTSAEAFDSFKEFYQNTVEELKKYDMVWLVDPKFLDPKNRTTINKDEINEKMRQAKETLIDLIREKTASLKALEQELLGIGKQLTDYLNKLGITKAQVSPKQIEIIKSYSTLEETIKPLGINVDDFLKRFNKTIKDLSPEELQVINNSVKDYIEQMNKQTIQNVETLDFLEEENQRRVA